VPYPTKRVVGTIADPQHAEAAVEALLRAGFARDDIHVLQGETGVHRLDPGDGEPGLLAQVQRRIVQSVGDFPEHSLKRHAEDLRAGKLVIMVLASRPQKRVMAGEILNAHGAEFIGYHGRWFWESLSARQAASTALDPARGQTYEVEVGGITRLQFLSATAATVGGSARPTHNATVVPIRPGMRILYWKDPQGCPVVHVHDYETGRAWAILGQRDGSLRNYTGTVRRLS
jgi:hypothetical protein